MFDFSWGSCEVAVGLAVTCLSKVFHSLLSCRDLVGFFGL